MGLIDWQWLVLDNVMKGNNAVWAYQVAIIAVVRFHAFLCVIVVDKQEIDQFAIQRFLNLPVKIRGVRVSG